MSQGFATAASYIRKILPDRTFFFLQPIYHFLWAFFSALWYGFPSQKLVVVGVTGTKGKTTVVELIHSILEASGAKVASLSSLRFKIGSEEIRNEFKMTMPGRGFVQKFLTDAANAGCRYAVIEVTSQGIQQFRHRFISFSAAVVTNVAAEHIEAHGSFEEYLRAKLDLFWRLNKDGVAVINAGDPAAERFAAATPAHRVFYGASGIRTSGEQWRVEDYQRQDGIQFALVSERKNANGVKRLDMRSPLEGEFNMQNILAAAAFGLSRHLSFSAIAEGTRNVSGVPGRMEWIQRKPFGVMVDYAHTPDSLRAVYKFLSLQVYKPENPADKLTNLQTSKLICVLGAAGGGRDRWKRPEMGRIAAEFCDRIVLTNEDPYDENPETIMKEIAEGIPSSKFQVPSSILMILDRREAIREALAAAKKRDTVVITGKGAEPWLMGPAGTKIPWDDRVVAREELERLAPVSASRPKRIRRHHVRS